MIYSKVLELYLPARQWSPFRKLVKRKGDVISGLVGSFILVILKSCSQFEFWEVLRYTANLQFPSQAFQVESNPVSSPYTLFWFVILSSKGSELYGEFTVSLNTLPKWKYSCFFAVYSVSILSSFLEVLALSRPTRL